MKFLAMTDGREPSDNDQTEQPLARGMQEDSDVLEKVVQICVDTQKDWHGKLAAELIRSFVKGADLVTVTAHARARTTTWNLMSTISDDCELTMVSFQGYCQRPFLGQILIPSGN